MLAEFTAPLSSALIVAAFTACVIPTSSACTISSFASRPNPSRSATDVLFCPIVGSAIPPTANSKVQTRASFIPAPLLTRLLAATRHNLSCQRFPASEFNLLECGGLIYPELRGAAVVRVWTASHAQRHEGLPASVRNSRFDSILKSTRNRGRGALALLGALRAPASASATLKIWMWF